MTKAELLKALSRLENKANAVQCYESQGILRGFGTYIQSIEPNQAELLVLEKFMHYLNAIDLNNQEADKAYAGMVRDILGNFTEFHLLNEIINKKLREDQFSHSQVQPLQDLYAKILPRLESMLSEGKLLENNKLKELNQLMRAYIEKHLRMNARSIPGYTPVSENAQPKKRKKRRKLNETIESHESPTSVRGFFENLTQFFQDLADPNQSPEKVIAQFVTSLIGLIASVFSSIFKPFLGPNADEQVANLADAAVNAFTRLSDVEESPARKQKPSPTFTPRYSAERDDLEEEESLRTEAAASVSSSSRRVGA